MNTLRFVIKSVECNGWPKLKFVYDNTVISDIVVNQEITNFELRVDSTTKSHVFQIERHSKNNTNTIIANDKIIKDQSIEIVSLYVDSIMVPDWYIWAQSKLLFNGQEQPSLYVSPNGTWRFEFDTPIITSILDKKILHESKYNQDYLYPWSYKLGPESVKMLSEHINQTINLVHKKL